mmetsp:Transcript_93729/g.242179  ORF Transcript_93729/g.242179 Transcript_93729/m.242179 type:complete len:391 (+) Transcript_93729:73-1245(+)
MRAIALALALSAGCVSAAVQEQTQDAAAQEQAALRGATRNATALAAGNGIEDVSSDDSSMWWRNGRPGCAGTYAKPKWPSAENNCLWTGSCCDPSMTCYLKQTGLFAGCMRSCAPGIHYDEPVFFWYRWRCDIVPSKYPAPSPGVPAPTPTTRPITPAPAPAPVGPSDADTLTFYMYRSQNDDDYPPKNVNTANAAGVMWYLIHEVMVAQPPKFKISRVLRYKVQSKAPQRLRDAEMNFGVRYAYDSQECTGPGLCAPQYTKWGYFVGCNYLGDFPYPKFVTHFPSGIWYSLPGDGECEGAPTGSFGCTYSYEAAGEATLDEITAAANASRIHDIWDLEAANQTGSDKANLAKVDVMHSVFKKKYPDVPAELPNPPCDFNFGKFYPQGLE